eukprot:TCALIF_08552-PA protein Name:"Protein of unknown function" AED:0.23 eAED:0.23 QI:53/1/0/1/0/0.5/2/0/206
MNCYDAFDDIISDFKGLLKHKRRTLGQLEEKFTLTIRDDQELIHRLEKQISQLKADLALEQAKRVPYLCAKCRKPLVHEQYSQAVNAGLDDCNYPRKWLTPTTNLPCVSPIWGKSPSPLLSKSRWNSMDQLSCCFTPSLPHHSANVPTAPFASISNCPWDNDPFPSTSESQSRPWVGASVTFLNGPSSTSKTDMEQRLKHLNDQVD